MSSAHLQRVNRARGFLQKAVAELLQASGDYVRIAMNVSLRKFSGVKHSPNIRPDNIGLTHEGQIDMFEIMSPGQDRDELVLKLFTAMSQLPEKIRGSFRVIDPMDALK